MSTIVEYLAELRALGVEVQTYMEEYQLDQEDNAMLRKVVDVLGRAPRVVAVTGPPPSDRLGAPRPSQLHAAGRRRVRQPSDEGE
jgi:hypothetical protein